MQCEGGGERKEACWLTSECSRKEAVPSYPRDNDQKGMESRVVLGISGLDAFNQLRKHKKKSRFSEGVLSI